MHFETPHNEIECILSIKDSNFNLIEEMLLYLKTYSLNFGKIFNLNISLNLIFKPEQVIFLWKILHAKHNI